MNLIVAVDDNWGIGNKGNLLFPIPQDLSFFKSKTTGNTVIMGRSTFDSLPIKPLPNRINYVLSKKGYLENINIKTEEAENLKVFKSLDDLFKCLSTKDSSNTYVIGGEMIYRLMLPYCTHAYVTKIYSLFEKDKYMPNLDLMNEWNQIYKSDVESHLGIYFTFNTYKNSSPLKFTT